VDPDAGEHEPERLARQPDDGPERPALDAPAGDEEERERERDDRSPEDDGQAALRHRPRRQEGAGHQKAPR
jgi:hypothetical protein